MVKRRTWLLGGVGAAGALVLGWSLLPPRQRLGQRRRVHEAHRSAAFDAIDQQCGKRLGLRLGQRDEAADVVRHHGLNIFRTYSPSNATRVAREACAAEGAQAPGVR